MTILKNEIEINASVEKIWAVLADMPTLEKYDPTVLKVELLSKDRTGIDAKRKVYMKDGKNWFEEKIVSFQPDHSLAIQLTNCTFPINSLKRTYSFSTNSGMTVVHQTMEYEVKFGFVGKLMDALVVRKQFNNGINQFMQGLKHIVEESR